jgi:hypothetical protein
MVHIKSVNQWTMVHMLPKRQFYLAFYLFENFLFLLNIFSIFTNFRPKAWVFKTSFKKTYFNTVLRIFSARYQFKKFYKQIFLTKLNLSYRLVYEFSYLVEKKFWSIFDYKGGLMPKKQLNNFPQLDMTMGKCFYHPPNRFFHLRKFCIKMLWLKHPQILFSTLESSIFQPMFI